MTNEEIGKRIEERRRELDYTLDYIAVRIGVAKSTIQRYEKGQINKIKLPVIESIAGVLHVNPNWLIGNTDDPTPQDVNIHSKNQTPDSGSRNIIKIAARDGTYQEHVLTDSQLAAVKAVLDQFPDASDDL